MASWEDDRMEDQIGSWPYDHHQESHSHGLSRLATCTTSNSTLDDNIENFDDDGLKTMLTQLSIENFDADEEFSDDNHATGGGQEEESVKGCLGLDFEGRAAGASCYSLPSTPIQQRMRQSDALSGHLIKQYASENERQKGKKKKKKVSRRKKREERKTVKDDEDDKMGCWSHCTSFSGESEGGGGLRVITRPKGGKSSLCMDMEEVKACRDLGFELELDMATMPSRLTLSASTIDTTSSGGSSPIPNWRISSPGDDPRDVKARLKVWAQAVALASTSPQGSSS